MTDYSIEGKSVNDLIYELTQRSWHDDQGRCWIYNFDGVNIRMPEGDTGVGT